MPLRTSELRWPFIALAIAVAVSLEGAHLALWGAAALGIAAGAIALLSPKHAAAAARALDEALQTPAPRTALMILAGGLLVVAHLLGVGASLLFALWLLASLALVGALRGRSAVRGLVLAGSVLLLTTAVCLGLAELVLRSPTLAKRFGSPQEKARWQQHYGKLRSRNLFGYRTRYEKLARAPESIRIVALGDSFTFGEVVEDTQDVWPTQLEEQLRLRHGGRVVEVVNMGRPGFTHANQVERLERFGWQWRPDIVVIQYLANDALPSYPQFRLDRDRRDQLYPRVRLVPTRYRTPRIAQSALVAFVEGRLSAALTAPLEERYRSLYDADEPGWIQTQQAMRRAGKSARERGVPIVLMIFPDLLPGVWTEETYPLNDIHAMVSEVAHGAGFEVLDLVPVFAAAGGDWRRFWGTPYDAHPNPEAHRLAAQALSRFMTSSRWYADSVAMRPVRDGGSQH